MLLSSVEGEEDAVDDAAVRFLWRRKGEAGLRADDRQKETKTMEMRLAVRVWEAGDDGGPVEVRSSGVGCEKKNGLGGCVSAVWRGGPAA